VFQMRNLNLKISQICQRARALQDSLSNSSMSDDQIHAMIFEMHELDHIATTWRDRPEWKYKTVLRSTIFPSQHHPLEFPTFVQFHGDIWLAYEWNYYRTT